MMNKLIITGGAGFIGSNFIRYILNHSDRYFIINLDLLTYAGNLENLDGIDESRYLFIKGNINDKKLLQSIFNEHQPIGIINFAAESHVDRSIENPNIFVETNVLGTANLLSISKDYSNYNKFRFLQVSTDEVYGTLPENKPEVKFTESTSINPHSPYSASKAGADHIVQSYHDTFGFDTIITRCSNNYGPYQFPEKLIPLIINNARNEKPLPVYGDGKNVRDWLYVDDHCSAILSAFEKGRSGEVYNIGGNNEIQNIEIVKMILDILGKPHYLITYVKDRLGHDRRYAIDSSKIQNELSWTPKVSPEIGLKQTVEWYIQNDLWLNHVISGDYINYYTKLYGNY